MSQVPLVLLITICIQGQISAYGMPVFGESSRCIDTMARLSPDTGGSTSSGGNRGSQFDPFAPFFHERLGIERNASKAQITAAYRTAVKIFHPDKGGTPEEFKRITEAFDGLIKGENAPAKAEEPIRYTTAGAPDPFVPADWRMVELPAGTKAYIEAFLSQFDYNTPAEKEHARQSMTEGAKKKLWELRKGN